MKLFARSVLLATAAGAITGCSLLGIGESEFSCPGLPKGLTCMSTKDVYKATNSGHDPSMFAPYPGMEDTKTFRESEAAKTKADYDYMPPRKGQVNMADYAMGGKVRPMLENTATVQPVLEAPKVARIWIGPWRDSKNNLVFPSYMYAQISDRTWSMGDSGGESMKQSKALTPVQVRNYSAMGGDGGMNAPKQSPREQVESGSVPPTGLINGAFGQK